MRGEPVNLFDKILKLVSMLPADALSTLVGLVDSLLSSKSPEDARKKLTAAALSAGYKAGARQAMKAAVNARAKL